MSVLVVGSIAIDTVKTPVEEHSDLLGGSASYAALGASFFSPVRLVGVVGNDFPETEFEFWKSRKIDTEGVQRVNGETFRWSGEYSWDLNTRETRSIALNVFENFKPVLPETYRQTDFVLLANIAPSLQAHVLEQMTRPRFVVADTMDLWIETARPDLDALLRRVNLLILNHSEARENEYRSLLCGTLIVVALGIGAVLICYFWIDRPVAFFVYRHHINTIKVFRWLTYPPPEVQNWSALILTILVVRRAWGPFLRWQKVLLVACLSLIVADDFRISLGDVFGRYWPQTWTHDNPSLIGTGTYGFHPFQRGDDIGSFPSGHACRILGFAAVWMIAMARSRTVQIVVIVLCAPMLVSLVAMNYHFVSDVIAGSVLGALIATYAAHLARLERPQF